MLLKSSFKPSKLRFWRENDEKYRKINLTFGVFGVSTSYLVRRQLSRCVLRKTKKFHEKKNRRKKFVEKNFWPKKLDEEKSWSRKFWSKILDRKFSVEKKNLNFFQPILKHFLTIFLSHTNQLYQIPSVNSVGEWVKLPSASFGMEALPSN